MRIIIKKAQNIPYAAELIEKIVRAKQKKLCPDY